MQLKRTPDGARVAERVACHCLEERRLDHPALPYDVERARIDDGGERGGGVLRSALVDEHGRVRGVDHVYAAGDATAFPVKQGGLAAQQADAVAEAVAAAFGAPLTPRPFRPVLRSLLVTGGADRFLDAALGGGEGDGETGGTALWSPPAKVAGLYLAPYLERR